jgi:signal recognition particle GTPase
MVGVNGVENHDAGKLAHQFQAAGENPLLVAADTFRAASNRPSAGETGGVDIIKGQRGRCRGSGF